MSYNCSLSAIQAPTSKRRGRFYVPSYRIAPPPFNSEAELAGIPGYVNKNWRLTPTVYVGTLWGFPHLGEVKFVARCGPQGLILRDNDTRLMVITSVNFKKILEVPGEP